MKLLYDPKALTESMELDYVRRPRPLGRWLKVFIWSAGAAALLIVVWAVWPSSHAALQAGPVSTPHATFNRDCGKCHTIAFATATRLVPGHGMFSTPKEACLQCHPAPNHNQWAPAENCADCHKEHRGDRMLARPADQHCTTCHANFDADYSSVSKKRNVPSFAAHPEFALWSDGKAADPGNVEFNHELHLGLRVDDEGKLAPIARPPVFDWDAVPLRPDAKIGPITLAVRALQQKQCAYCHEPETAGAGPWTLGSGRYMKPIQFDQHCQQCHPLLLPLKAGTVPNALKQAPLAFMKEPLPHPQKGQTAWHVRAAARERYLKFSQTNADILKLPNDLPQDWLVLPGFARRGVPATPGQIEWVNDQWNQAEALLFDTRAGCAHCHKEISKENVRADGLPVLAQPSIPTQWFKSSVFDHHAHQMLQCADCHEKALTSNCHTDVLIPKLAKCQSCHQTQPGSARADCVECHQFHHRADTPAWQGKLTLKDFKGD